MIVRNKKQADTLQPALYSAVLALMPDTGKAAVFSEKMALDALRKDPAWADKALSEDQIKKCFEQGIAEGKLAEVNPSVAPAVEAPKVG